MDKDFIETQSSEISIDEHGILKVIKKQGSYEIINDAMENIAAIKKITKGNSFPSLVDIRKMQYQDADAVTYYANMAKSTNCLACAILIDPDQSKTHGKTNQQIQGSIIPTAIFTDEQMAIDWLKSMIN
ncbi:hypothetical protein JYT36_00870 [Bacteroidales bacterium AH-315-N07]|nr:hypothetical protein [Bacteroidales bacterium AH-315-N07]